METREEIIHLADQQIRSKGYNSFSYNDVAGIMAIRNAAIHYYFPKKADLGEAVIDAELDRTAQYRAQHAGMAGEEQLKYFVGTFYRHAIAGNGCLVGSLASDFKTFDNGLQIT